MADTKIPGGTVHKLPKDLKTALGSDKTALLKWNDITPLARNEWICWVSEAAKNDTRLNRLRRVISELKEGKRRPCCWLGCIHRKDKKISPSVKGILNFKKLKEVK